MHHGIDEHVRLIAAPKTAFQLGESRASWVTPEVRIHSLKASFFLPHSLKTFFVSQRS